MENVRRKKRARVSKTPVPPEWFVNTVKVPLFGQLLELFHHRGLLDVAGGVDAEEEEDTSGSDQAELGRLAWDTHEKCYLGDTYRKVDVEAQAPSDILGKSTANDGTNDA